MTPANDLDQGGVFRETTRVYMGPSLGWSQQVSAPPVTAIAVTTPGTTVVPQGVSTVHVNVNGSVTIQLYAAKGNAAGAGQVPGSFVQVTLIVNDIGGFASSFPITILPAVGETIGGSTMVTIAANYGLFVLLSDVQNGGWTVASGTSGTAIADAPSDGSTYGRLNAAWSKVLPLAGGTLTGPLTIPSGAVSGVLTAPTPAVDTNTTQVANTAFVLAQASAPGDGTPAMEGVASRGVSTHFARADHVHPIFALRGYLSGLALSTAGASTTFSVAAGMACDNTFAAMMVLVASISKTTAAWTVGSGNGALDTGGITINTWYHVYLITRPDTGVVDVAFSLNATGTLGANVPAAYTLKRRIGAMLINASSQWTLFHQLGDQFLWDVRVVDQSGVTTSTTAALQLLTVPTGVQVEALINARLDAGGAGLVSLITSPDESDQAASNTVGSISAAASSSASTDFSVRTNTSAQIRHRENAATATLRMSTRGWNDRRGRDA